MSVEDVGGFTDQEVIQRLSECVQELEQERDRLRERRLPVTEVAEYEGKLYEAQQERQRLEAQVMSLINRQASTRENVVKLKERVRALRLERAELQAKVKQALQDSEVAIRVQQGREAGFKAATGFYLDWMMRQERPAPVTTDGMHLAGPFTAEETAAFLEQIKQADVQR